jgi:hypothetical protein
MPNDRGEASTSPPQLSEIETQLIAVQLRGIVSMATRLYKIISANSLPTPFEADQVTAISESALTLIVSLGLPREDSGRGG